jgi:ribosomal-protein-alanine N-acetyltransferase
LTREVCTERLRLRRFRAGIEWGFGGLHLDRIISIIDPGNVASVRVAEKLGMRPGRDEVHPGGGQPLRVYERTAAG